LKIMAQPFTPTLCELADSMGIAMYQRFTPVEASLFLRCATSDVERLIKRHDIEFIQVTSTQVEFFGFQLLNHLLNSIQGETIKVQEPNAVDKIIRSKEVQELTSLSRTTIWRLERKGEFPARVPLTSGSIGWRLSEVREWIITC
ncbi:MAG: AlpA family transcriptional regulator, partial [Methylococcales bacterium]|nr:AlpA family transcriptional regulator [Methylococcales bacterium]